MAFDKFGNFIPNAMQGEQKGILPDGPPDPGKIATQQAAIKSTVPTGAQFNISPSFATNNAMRQAQPLNQQPEFNFGNAYKMAGGTINNAINSPSYNPPANYYGGPLTRQYIPPQQQPRQQVLQAPQPIQQMPQFQQPQYYIPQQPQRSLEQMVNTGNAQSVQNFLTALNKVGAGSNNTFQNQQGAMGAGPQGGFQGFGVNGQIPNNQYNQAYSPVQSQLGYVNNAAIQNPMMNAQNLASQGQYNFAGQGTGTNQLGQGTYPGNPTGISNIPTGGSQISKNIRQNPDGTVTDLNTGVTGNAWTNVFTGQSGITPAGAPISGSGPSSMWQEQQNMQNGGTGSSPSPWTWDIAPGSIPTVSDKQAKTDIKSGEDELKDFLDNLGVYSYEYKDEKYGEGRRISPMAQEIEKTKLGKDAILENDEGYKMVDYGKLAGTQLAALAMLNNKYNELSNKYKNIEKAIHEKISKRGK